MSRRVQRIAINVVFLLLTLLPVGATQLLMKWPIWATALLVALFGVGASAIVSNQFPQEELPLPSFLTYLARAVTRAVLPVLALALVYTLLFWFQTTVANVAAIGVSAWVFFTYSLPGRQIPLYVQTVVRGRSQPMTVNGRSIKPDVLQGDTGITWGGIKFPSKIATSHFMVVGTTGSGKSITIRLLVQEALRPIGSGADHRALIYDAKQDMASQLAGMGFDRRNCKIFTLNPFDARCLCWDIARDVTEPTTAFQVASLLIPQDKNASQPFFTDAAQSLLYGVLMAYMRQGTKWRFSDVIRAMQTPARLEEILKSTDETRPIAERFFGNRDTLGSIMATVATKMIIFEPIAAMWDKAYDRGHTLSLTEWVSHRGKDNCILILGNNEKARRPLDALNRVLFQRATELILDQEENRDDSRRTWLFLDEAAEAGNLEGLQSLLAKGRSKGACVVLGFQDIEALREVYGEKIANSLTGQCNNKAILRLESPNTAEWASKLFGSYEAIEWRRSDTGGSSSGPQGGSSSNSTTYAEQYVKREAVLESQLYLLPVTNKKNGLSGYYIVPDVGAYFHVYAGDVLFGKSTPDKPVDNDTPLLMGNVTDVEDILRRDGSEQHLSTWKLSDLLNLGIPALATAGSKPASATPAAPPASVPGGAPTQPGTAPAPAGSAPTSTEAGLLPAPATNRVKPRQKHQ